MVGKLLRPIDRLFRKIDAEVREEIDEKVSVGTRAALQQVDEDLPIATALLAGKPVRIEVTVRLAEVKE